ncbi:hypothetical protein, partial [Arcobacter sp.]|uniref:hypothetical protein n=1 Tax=Arcobacter sp. TaxID=1872629 RepID=UPI003D100E08
TSKKNYKISTINKFLALLLFSLLITLATYFILLKNHNEKIDDLAKIEKEKTEFQKENNLDKILEEYEKNHKTTIVDKYEEYNNDLEKEYIHQKDFEKVEEVLKEKNKEIQSVEKKVFPKNKEPITEEKAREYIPLPPLEKSEEAKVEKDEKVSISIEGYEKLLIELNDSLRSFKKIVFEEFEMPEETIINSSTLL